MSAVDDCPTCHETGRMGYCARLRCYCGHKDCWAFDSYYELEPLTAAVVSGPDERMAKSWKEREEPTWLDR